MKRILMAASALAALGVAGTAMAASNESTQAKILTVTGTAPAQCHISAPSTFVQLPNGSLVDSDGFAQHNIGSTVATGLTNLKLTAWCTGNHNSVNLFRSALVNTVHFGAHGPGSQDANGFDTAVLYDVAVNIAGATRSDHVSPLEGSSDGIGNGPGFGVGGGISVSNFGATSAGAVVSFVTEGPNSEAISKAKFGAIDVGDDSDFTGDTLDRLAAGPYLGLVTLVVKPGV